MKQSKVGLWLASFNVSLILVVAVIEFFIAKGSSGWLFLYPILWNLPSSLLLIPLMRFHPPDWLLLILLISIGTLQWYFIDCGIEVLARKKCK